MNRPSFRSVESDQHKDKTTRRYQDYLQDTYSFHLIRGPYALGFWCSVFGTLFLLSESVAFSLASLAMALLLLCFGVWRLRAARQKQKLWAEFAQRGEMVAAYLLMANSSLFTSGLASAPGLALIAFEDQRVDNSQMMDLCMAMEEPEKIADTDGSQFAQSLMREEQYVRNRRRKLPVSLTGGCTIYAVDLWIPRYHLVNDRLEMPFLACMAEAGDEGRIEVIPQQLLANASPPP